MTTALQHEMTIIAEGAPGGGLPGTLSVPEHTSATGLVIFVHGSGSSRHSSRNIAVAQHLVDEGLATFLFDLLTPAEAMDRRNVFDIPLLAQRVIDATNSLKGDATVSRLPVGYFGASTGAAAALVAAARLGDTVSAVVSRGGRPDLADEALPKVTAPTLLLVGSLDHEVIELNRQAQAQMTCRNELVIVPGASHLFEEPGRLEIVADHAARWFTENFAR
jgi:putative phosphoribosyl transferase